MTFVVLELFKTQTKNTVDSFFLSAPNALANRLVNESEQNVGSTVHLENQPYGTVFKASTSIELYKLLNWIESKGYELHSVLPVSEANGEKYIFQKKTG